MFNRLKALLAPPETKSSRTARLVAFENGGRARWTPRDYTGLAREGYLANAIVHRSVRLIAENAAACCFLVFEGAQERDAHPLAQLLTRPNPRQDGGVFFEMLYAHLLLAGNAYIEAVALGDRLRELYALRPDRMKVVPGADGWAEAYDYCVGGRSVRFDQLAFAVPPILHLTFFHPLDDHYGLAPIEAAAVAVDAAIQIAVLDLNRTAPPSSPAEGERHVVATGATGAWAGHANAIATWQDGAWALLVPKSGWCIWSAADDVMFVFDGTHWRDLRDLPVTLDNAVHVGINTTASAPNLLSVKSNAALLTALNGADGGSGDARLQISKESAAKTASVFFSDAFSGRAEFGLVGSDAFKLKVSADGSAWVEAFTIDQTTGNLALPRGLALTGVISPPQITANQNDYNPTGVAAAAVLQLSSDASRNITGLAGGAEGRIVSLINIGSQPIVLPDESTSSSAANRFTLGANLTVAAKQAAMLRYDGTAARWRLIAGATGLLAAANNLSDVASVAAARGNLGVREQLTANRTYYVRTDGSDGNNGLANSSGGAFLTIQKAIDTVAALDISVYSVTINVADATYTGAVTVTGPWVGSGTVTLQGNTTTPANVVITTAVAGAAAVSVQSGGRLSVAGFKLVSSGAGATAGLKSSGSAILVTGAMDFGAANRQMQAAGSGSITFGAGITYNISAGAVTHIFCSSSGNVAIEGCTITTTGTVAFSGAFVTSSFVGVVFIDSDTFTGASATGSRYSITANGVVYTAGAGATYLPGNAAGSTSSGGQYI